MGNDIKTIQQNVIDMKEYIEKCERYLEIYEKVQELNELVMDYIAEYEDEKEDDDWFFDPDYYYENKMKNWRV